MPRQIYAISRVARRLGLSVRTIRHYEEEDFFTMERISGRCYLRPGDIEIIALAERLRKDLGVNLAGVGVVLEMRQNILALKNQLDQLEADLEKQIFRAHEEMRREMSRPLAPLGSRSVTKVRGEDD
ncbi:MAG: MerR family transcriptional regulator [Candidatus Adiutricales bacterium]